mmetsp:Transcript_12343/g.10644  ORF Transcript_12343/g.10644 Transcript_12343/m.10644 type:complete len:84 (-) Transcript_12343:205-456(-)|eukprot:CAMPEP_0114577338 /NCGR_PEP_ID=MMETSP0125-20121206/2007_1 /TAXON_ID=485358 ORGANISM="Aristerostoma sp., Strain ATCC 50986" /NCGR_SAMPLE_ID=MMETSP0125 /ASSEMBLY_ACC=CAM_ASM_000245 /LENGTH=83 /DNA_ID=CAMNT_0001766567 /DNA_START=240 /DNA_END=491 /DNA_ORIENTATION=+
MPTGPHLVEMIVIVLLGIIIIALDITLIMTLGDLNQKWKKYNEKGSIKTAVFDKTSYETMLQNSILLKSGDESLIKDKDEEDP